MCSVLRERQTVSCLELPQQPFDVTSTNLPPTRDHALVALKINPAPSPGCILVVPFVHHAMVSFWPFKVGDPTHFIWEKSMFVG